MPNPLGNYHHTIHFLYGMVLYFAQWKIVFNQGILDFLRRYCEASRQKLNCNKSKLILDEGVSLVKRQIIKNVTGFSHQSALFEYLSMHIFQGRIQIDYFEKIINATTMKIDGWATKLLSLGDKLALMKHVLCSEHIYLLLAFTIPVGVIDKLESRLYSFLWGNF